MNLDSNTLDRSEPEVQARVRRGRVARGGGHRAHLMADDHASADAIAVAPCSGQPDNQPAIGGCGVVDPQLDRRSKRQDDEVEAAVTVEIRSAAAAMGGDSSVEPRACRRVAEAPAAAAQQEGDRRRPGDRAEMSKTM